MNKDIKEKRKESKKRNGARKSTKTDPGGSGKQVARRADLHEKAGLHLLSVCRGQGPHLRIAQERRVSPQLLWISQLPSDKDSYAKVGQT